MWFEPSINKQHKKLTVYNNCTQLLNEKVSYIVYHESKKQYCERNVNININKKYYKKHKTVPYNVNRLIL